jgi:DNA gyrase subunit B
MRMINTEFLSLPEFRKTRAQAKVVSKFNKPPFTLIKDGQKQTVPDWRELLKTVTTEGTREVNIQRYKGLGEMNAEQLWSTTMNAESRTLLRVDLNDFAEAEPIFSTLMGEDVESRRKFIEDNALDVRNLDV